MIFLLCLYHFIYSLIDPRTCGLCPALAVVTSTVMGMGVHIPFQLFSHALRNGIAGSCEIYISEELPNCFP